MHALQACIPRGSASYLNCNRFHFATISTTFMLSFVQFYLLDVISERGLAHIDMDAVTFNW